MGQLWMETYMDSRDDHLGVLYRSHQNALTIQYKKLELVSCKLMHP
jgi:hypothetical protein